MKRVMIGILIFLLSVIILVPAIINWPSRIKGGRESEQSIQYINVYVTEEKKVIKMPLEEYLIGVVAAEMPAKFELEALKAQAIAARTYTAKRMLLFSPELHPNAKGAEVCTDSTHCQGWYSKEELRERWGLLKYPVYLHKVRKAVEATQGKVLVYNDQLTDPVYHGSCGGIGTEDSESVWKYAIPYLRAVECSWDDMSNPSLTNEVEMSLQAFSSRLGLKLEDPEGIKKILENSNFSNERLLEIPIPGEESISGNVTRQKLGLHSAALSWEVLDDKIKITTKGKGHGVGMCQYGANGMAKEGKKYQEILTHYYQGVKITNLEKFL